MNLPPGSSGLPFVGDTIAFLRDPRYVDRRMARYGKIFRTRLFGRPTVIVVGHELIRQVLMQPDIFHFKEGLPLHAQNMLGDSLLTQEGQAHQRSRRLLAAAFQPAAAARYVPAFQMIIDDHLQKWIGPGPIDITVAARKLTFALISRFLLGTAPTEDTEGIVQDFEAFFAGLIALPSPLPGSRYRRAVAAHGRIRLYLATLVAARRRYPGDDLISQLVREHGTTLTDGELTNHVLLLLMAGHETTATLIMESIILATADNWLAQLQAERDQFPSVLTANDLAQQRTLVLFVREVGRMFPPGHNGFRHVITTTELGGYTIPAGWTCVYRPVETQRDPQMFAHPHCFAPDRAAPPRSEPSSSFALLTFGGGPRICIGQFVGLTVVQQVLATLLAQTTWHANPSLIHRLDQARAVYHGFPVQFVARAAH